MPLDTVAYRPVGMKSTRLIMYLHLMNKFFVLLAGVIAFACTEISYKEPQPKGEKSLLEVPSRLHGQYVWQGDTITFFAQGFRAKEKDKKEDMLLLSDSIVLRKYKSYYFVSYRSGQEWLLRILKPQKNGDLIYMEMENVPEEEAQRKPFIENLSAETPVIQTTVDSVTHYIIDPSPKKLYSLILKGFFKEKGSMVKIK